MKKKYIYLINIIILLLVILSSIGISVYKYNTNVKNKQVDSKNIEEIKEEKIDYQEELNKVKNEYNNNDIVGILSIEDTNFNEIVMQSTDNDYYLEHTVYHESNWRGQTFLDYRNNINDSDKLDPLGMEEFLPSNIEGEIESNNSKNVENNSYRPLDTRIEKKKKTKQTYLNSKIDDGIIVDENGEELIEGPNGHKKSGNGTEIEKGNGGQAILGTAGEGHRSEKEKIKISNIKTPYMNEPGKYIISFVPEVTSPNCELKVRLAGEDVFENIKIKKMYLLDEHGKSEINTFDVIEQKKITLEVYFDDINRAALEVNCYAKK